MMIRWIIIIVFLLLVAPLVAQEIEEYPVNDFSGGLVNSISNSLMKDNQALVLDNFDIDGYGALKRRNGFRQYYIDSLSEQIGQAVFGYYGRSIGKGFLVIRNDTTRSGDYGLADPALNMGSLFLCDDESGGTCTTFIGWNYYLGRRHLSLPYNERSAIVNENLIIASTSSEMVVFDGNKSMPARPYASGQPRAYPLDGTGTITGSVRYRYIFTNANCPDASVPSFKIWVESGKVWVEGMILPSAGDSLKIYRQDNQEGAWHLVKSNYANSFVDSVSMDSAASVNDTLLGKSIPDTLWTTTDPYSTDTCAPGGIIVEITQQFVADTVNWIYGIDLDTTAFNDVTYGVNAPPLGYYYGAWAVVYIDSAGRHSYMSPPTIQKISYWDTAGSWVPPNDSTYIAMLTSIPVPDSDWNIKHKILLRMMIDGQRRWDCSGTPGKDYLEGFFKFYVIDTINIDSTTYGDSIPFSEFHYIAGQNPALYGDVDYISLRHKPEYCNIGDIKLYQRVNPSASVSIANYRNRLTDSDLTTWDVVEGYCNDDSVISFCPSDIALHQSRLFAIGNPWNKNMLYFSGFGKPTNWHRDKFINIPSQRGDWFNGLLSMGDWLLAFRQNSFVGFAGQSFYQYQIKELSADIGLTAPRSLAGGYNRAFWAHNTGVYSFPGDNWDNPISWTIKNSLDSMGDNLMSAWGGVVGDEYWFSGAITDSINEKIYIYSFVPFPHWKCYTFGIIDGVPYDYESDAADYRTTRWIFISDNDTLYDWNYADTSLDGTDSVFAVYQSKSFFDNGNNREQIFYVDLQGTGSCDMLSLSFFDLKGQDSIKTVSHAVDFTEKEIQRFVVKEIVRDFSVRISDHGAGDYTITGYTIGYLPSDRGRIR